MLIFLFSYVNQANAQELTLQQRILMPGPLTSGHAEFEPDCENCHESFQQTEMSSLCLGCHEDIAADRSALRGFHGKSNLARNSSCDSCHTDHEGRDADITGLLVDRFNHTETDFPLLGSHEITQCSGCHEDNSKFSGAPNQCSGCHLTSDIHNGTLGNECQSCHQTLSWEQLLPFDHNATDFALAGLHEELKCSSCHLGQVFEFPDTTCFSCHQNSDIHLGVNGTGCESCHSATGWETVTFDHDDTGFLLTGVHAEAACIACHEDGMDVSALGMINNSVQADTPSCNSCHLSDDPHLGRNGDQCDSCHLADSWSEIQFDHGMDTDFMLTGQHSDLSCTSCHTGLLSTTLPQDCNGCHLADDVHQEAQMGECSNCHITQDWQSVAGFDHDFSTFPLLGMHSIVTCENCHLDMHFTATQNECSDCHALEDVHSGGLGAECQQCHTPNAWDIWQFDHSTQTDFQLLGSHEELSCSSCHLPDTNPEVASGNCISCHQSEDIHFGEFGNECGQCHTTTNFSETTLLGVRPWPR